MLDRPASRRAQPRFAFALEVAVRGPKGIVQGRCQEVNTEGLFLEIPEVYPERTVVDVKFVLPGDSTPILSAGKVASVQRAAQTRNFFWMWIQFEDLRAEYRERLLRFVGLHESPVPAAEAPVARARPLDAAGAASSLDRRERHADRAAQVRARTEPALQQHAPAPAAGASRSALPSAGIPVTQRFLRPPVPAPARPTRAARAQAQAQAPALRSRAGHPPERGEPSVEPIDAFVIRFGSARQFVTTYVENISKGGVFLRSSAPLAEQSPVVLVLHLPDGGGRVYVEGKVVWVRKHPTEGMGIQFGTLDALARDAIDAYLAKLEQTNPLTLNMWKMS